MVKKLQKFSFFKSPWVIAAFICFAIAFAIPFFAPKTTDVKGVSKKATPTPTHSASSGQAATSTEAVSETGWIASPTHSASSGQATATSVPQQAASTATTTPTHSASSGQAQQSQTVETFQVHLSINGSSVGDVTMQKDQNQCDVLTRAKEQGKISQLLMKYDNSLGTNGVYQINGTGKENAVWWTYTVNGIFPGQGCSYVKANSGDTVVWEYQGN
jgi:hypothetical protein